MKDVIVVFCEMVQTVVQPEEQGKLNAEKEKNRNIGKRISAYFSHSPDQKHINLVSLGVTKGT